MTNIKDTDFGFPVHKKGSSLYFGIVSMVLCLVNVGIIFWYKRAANINNQDFYPRFIRPRNQGYAGLDDELRRGVFQRDTSTDDRNVERDVVRDDNAEQDDHAEQMADGPVGANPEGGNPRVAVEPDPPSEEGIPSGGTFKMEL